MTTTKILIGLSLCMQLHVTQAARADEETDSKVAKLADQLSSNNWKVRRNAATALGKMGKDAKAAVPALKDRIGDGLNGVIGLYTPSPIDESRIAALLALSEIAPKEVLPALQTAANESPSLYVRVWAAKQYKAIQKELQKSKR
jgi:HEAT repeat protein